MATPAAGTVESKEDKSATSPIVIVELGEPQPAMAVRRMRKGKGKLFRHVERIISDLAADGTVKASAQPVVIVVHEIPSPPWAGMMGGMRGMMGGMGGGMMGASEDDEDED
jgi:nitrate/nitrite transporter NarK